MLDKEISKEKFIYLYFIAGASIILLLINILFGYPKILTNSIAILSTLYSFYLCYIYRYNIGLFLVMVFIAYTNYSITTAIYIYPSLRPKFFYDQFEQVKTFGIGISCIFIFVLSMILFSSKIISEPKSISSSENKLSNKSEYNQTIAVFAPVVFLIIFLLNFTLNKDGSRGGSSALGEYRVLIMIIGSYYSQQKRLYRVTWTVIVVITSVLVVLSKNRVDAFAPIIFLLIYWYPKLFDYKKMIMLLPFAIIILVSIGDNRSSNEGLGLIQIDTTVNDLKENKIVYSGATFAYMPALAIVELTDKTMISDKITLLINHIVYIFKFGAASSSRSSLSGWSYQYYSHCFGFISPVYFYFWFGYLGAFLFALLVNFYTNLYKNMICKELLKFKDKVFYIFSLYFISNVARWYEYGPMPLLRGMFVCFVLFTIVYIFNTFTSREEEISEFTQRI